MVAIVIDRDINVDNISILKRSTLNSSQQEGGHDGPADKLDEALESDLHF